jgi:hypothetical protein
MFVAPSACAEDDAPMAAKQMLEASAQQGYR